MSMAAICTENRIRIWLLIGGVHGNTHVVVVRAGVILGGARRGDMGVVMRVGVLVRGVAVGVGVRVYLEVFVAPE